MRRSLCAAALLATTCLTPDPAYAGPVLGFVAGALGIGAGSAIAATAAFTAGATFAATAVGGFVVKTVVAIGLSALAAKLAPQPEIAQLPPSSRMVNFAQPKAYAEYVYGRTRKGGPLGFTGFKEGKRFYVPILAAHEIHGFVEHWLDEWPVTLTSEPSPSLSNVATVPVAGYGRVHAFRGNPGQTHEAVLTSNFPEITAAHDFKGLAGATIWAQRPPQENFSNIYPRGREWAYAPVIDGKNDLYDPRDQTFKYSNNAALVLADWVITVLGRDVDWGEVTTEAFAADQLVSNKGGGTQARWTLNGTVSDEQSFEDQRSQMAAACDALFYERTDGKVGFKLGRWVEPTLTLTDDDFYQVVEVQGGWGADRPDEVAVTYIEPANAWRETPSGVWVERSVAKPIRDEPQLYLINNHNQAARVCKRLARTKNAQHRVEGQVGMVGYEILGGGANGGAHRFVRLQLASLGIDDVFEVGEMAREGPAAFALSLNSVAAADFDFDAATEEPAQPEYKTVISDGAIQDPSGLGGSALPGAAIQLTWSAQPPAYFQEIRFRKLGGSFWNTTSTSPGVQSTVLSGFGDGETIEVQFRNAAWGIGVSNWVPAVPAQFSTVVDPTPPPALIAFAAVSPDNVDIEVTFTAPNSSRYFGTRIYRATSSNFGSATLIHTEYGIPSEGDLYRDVEPAGGGSGTFYYWGAPINSSGVEGPLSGPESDSVF